MIHAALTNPALFYFLVFMTLLLVMFLGAVIAAPPASPASPVRETPATQEVQAPVRPAPLPHRQPRAAAPAADAAGWSADADHAASHDAAPMPVHSSVRRPEVSGSPPWGPAAKPPGPDPLGSREPRAWMASAARRTVHVPGCRAAHQQHATAGHARARRHPGQASQAQQGTLISGSGIGQAAAPQRAAGRSWPRSAPSSWQRSLGPPWLLGLTVPRARYRGRVIAGVGAAALAALFAWRWRNRKANAARAMPHFRRRWRGQLAAPEGAAPGCPTGESARELPGGLHLYFHGVSLESVAAILERYRHGG
jgi:hypothetical protein